MLIVAKLIYYFGIKIELAIAGTVQHNQFIQAIGFFNYVFRQKLLYFNHRGKSGYACKINLDSKSIDYMRVMVDRVAYKYNLPFLIKKIKEKP